MKAIEQLPRELGSYTINRTTTQVSFGCGAVKIRKADLATLISALPALKRIRKAGSGYVNLSTIVRESTITTLKQILG